MPSPVERYRAGETQVLLELRDLAERVGEEAAYKDAWLVAQEVVDRAFENLVRLRSRLAELGYEFLNPRRVLVEASSTHLNELATLESKHGSLPLLLRAWYERIECVDFRQADNQLAGDERSRSLGIAGLGKNAVLVVHSVSEGVELKRKLLSEAAASEGDTPSGVDDRFFLPLGGWASNSEPKGIFVPSRKFDDVIYNDGGGDVFFLDDLRLAFRWGGFPFWSPLILRPKRLRPPGPVPAFAELLPKLIDGLRLV